MEPGAGGLVHGLHRCHQGYRGGAAQRRRSGHGAEKIPAGDLRQCWPPRGEHLGKIWEKSGENVGKIWVVLLCDAMYEHKLELYCGDMMDL